MSYTAKSFGSGMISLCFTPVRESLLEYIVYFIFGNYMYILKNHKTSYVLYTD